MPSKQIKDGFLHQRMYVLNEEEIDHKASVYVTDVGFFPSARDHYVQRKFGCKENIIILCISGCGFVNDKKVNAGDLLTISSGTEHYYRADDENPWDIYWVHFIDNLRDYPKGVNIQKSNIVEIRKYISVIENIILSIEMVKKNESNRFYNESLSYLLSLIDFTKRYKKINPLIEECNSYILSNIDKPIEIETLCRICGVSRSKLHKTFKLKLNTSPIKYYIDMKLGFSEYYLLNTLLNIKEIADMLGFEDAYYFSRVFKSKYGLSPKNYRDRDKKSI